MKKKAGLILPSVSHRFIILVFLAVLAATSGSANAAPPPSSVSGLVYSYDGLNTAVAAQQVGAALSAMGYANTTYTNGRSARQAWVDGQNDAVFGVFGHSNAAQISTNYNGGDPNDWRSFETLLADSGIIGFGGISTYYYGYENLWFWSDYYPLDVDDMRLAILAGCDTANVSPDWGSFGQVGKQKGIDSIIGFTDLIRSPANCGNSCLYSGNYFWSRFAVYVQNGDTIGNALSKAVSDLVAKEPYWGAQGYDKFKIEGALATPGDVRLVPAAYGVMYNSQPVGGSSSSSIASSSDVRLAPAYFIDLLNSGFLGDGPSSIAGLTTISQRSFTIDNRQVWDYETAQGISYRLDANTGELLWFASPASTMGQGELTEDEAHRAAVDFAGHYVSGFKESDGLVTISQPNHLDGDDLFGYSWRMSTPSGPGPRLVDIEVDRRTGAIVYFAQAEASPSTTTFAISQAEAINISQEAVGTATTLESAVSEVWNKPVWTVTLNRAGESLTHDFIYVLIDGQTGEVIHQAAT